MEALMWIEEKWHLICWKLKPFFYKCGLIFGAIGRVIHITWAYLFRLRAFFMAVPVALAAVWLAFQNMARLPDSVGIDIQNDGSYLLLVPKEMAVFGPVAITAFCILMMVCSKKTLYPWLISIFSLVLPLLIYFTNMYPA